jgi:hypothetical protein
MFARFGCILLSAGWMLAMPALAEEERRDVPVPETAGLQEAAYDVILVPRPAGTTRSRMFNGERWVTLPNSASRQTARPYQRPDRPQGRYQNRYENRYQGSQPSWTQRDPRGNTQRNGGTGYTPRTYVEDFRSGQPRYRAFERRYPAGSY